MRYKQLMSSNNVHLKNLDKLEKNLDQINHTQRNPYEQKKISKSVKFAAQEVEETIDAESSQRESDMSKEKR
tara:strand:+ start:553 stop:768 length:216 start_codon:yes stop_codon:yes gene_type:complete